MRESGFWMVLELLVNKEGWKIRKGCEMNIYIYMNEKNVQLCHGTDGKGKGSAEFCVCFSGNDVIHPPSGESLLQHYLGS